MTNVISNTGRYSHDLLELITSGKDITEQDKNISYYDILASIMLVSLENIIEVRIQNGHWHHTMNLYNYVERFVPKSDFLLITSPTEEKKPCVIFKQDNLYVVHKLSLLQSDYFKETNGYYLQFKTTQGKVKFEQNFKN